MRRTFRSNTAYQLEPYAARRPEGEEVAAGVDVVRVGNTDGKLRYRSRQPVVPVAVPVPVSVTVSVSLSLSLWLCVSLCL